MSHTAAGELAIKAAGEELLLLPEKAVYWPAGRLLLLADLHLGKSETFRRYGIPLPAGFSRQELARLAALVARLGDPRVLLLGDVIHGRDGLTDEVVDAFGAFTTQHAVRAVVGNHDRHLPADLWPELELIGEGVREGPFAWYHEPPPDTTEGFACWGHLHPTHLLRGGGDYLRLPCFLLEERGLMLPAWSEFTNGVQVKPAKGESVFVVGDGCVMRV